jgi:hypothetical protein
MLSIAVAFEVGSAQYLYAQKKIKYLSKKKRKESNGYLNVLD